MSDHVSGDQISTLVDLELNPSDSRAVEEHLRLCATCRAEYDEAASITRLFRSVEEVHPPPYLWQRILQETGRSTKPALPSWYGLRAQVWAAAAALIIAIGGTLGFFAYRAESVSRQMALQELDQIGKTLMSRSAETHNPFRRSLEAGWDSNPFSEPNHSKEVNPFSSALRP